MKTKFLSAVVALVLFGVCPASKIKADILTVSFSALPQQVAPNELVELKLTLTIPFGQEVPGGPTGTIFIQGFNGQTVTITDGQGNSSIFNVGGGFTSTKTFVFDTAYSEPGSYHPGFSGLIVVAGIAVPPPECLILPIHCPGITVMNGFDISGETTVYVTPIPAALPLFATGLGALGLLGWRRKKKAATAK